jgi:hypothetical protein
MEQQQQAEQAEQEHTQQSLVDQQLVTEFYRVEIITLQAAAAVQ